jgi:predicted transcriptional regulator
MSLEQMLRKHDIERKLRMTSANSYYLRNALINYEVLLDVSLTGKEKAKRLDVSKSTIDKQMCALNSCGLIDSNEAKKYKDTLLLQT